MQQQRVGWMVLGIVAGLALVGGVIGILSVDASATAQASGGRISSCSPGPVQTDGKIRWRCEVTYTFEGQRYSTIIQDTAHSRPSGSRTVYVDPTHPTHAEVGLSGAAKRTVCVALAIGGGVVLLGLLGGWLVSWRRSRGSGELLLSP